MPNMSYCRFQNTALALKDCENALRENSYDFDILREELSEEEFRALLQLIKIAKRIAITAGEQT